MKTVPTYKLWVNEKRTVLVRMWANGDMEIAFRDSLHHAWGPPIRLIEEKLT